MGRAWRGEGPGHEPARISCPGESRPHPGKRRLRPHPGKRRLRSRRAQNRGGKQNLAGKQNLGGKQNPTGKRGRPLGIPPPIRRTQQPVPGPGPHRPDRLCERRSGKLRVDRADPDGGRRTGDSGDSRAGGVGRRVPVGLRAAGERGAVRFCGMGTGREIRRPAGAPRRPLGGAS